MGNDQYSFSEIFPALRRLELGVEFSAKYLNKIDLEFLLLQYLSVMVSGYDGEIYNLIQNIIRKNPQIQGITSRSLYSRMIEFVHDKLPQLKNLELIDTLGYENSNSQIDFEQVESYTIKKRSPFKINFNFNNSLRFFETNVNLNDDSFLDIIMQNQQFEELKLVVHCTRWNLKCNEATDFG